MSTLSLHYSFPWQGLLIESEEHKQRDNFVGFVSVFYGVTGVFEALGRTAESKGENSRWWSFLAVKCFFVSLTDGWIL